MSHGRVAALPFPSLDGLLLKKILGVQRQNGLELCEVRMLLRVRVLLQFRKYEENTAKHHTPANAVRNFARDLAENWDGKTGNEAVTVCRVTRPCIVTVTGFFLNNRCCKSSQKSLDAFGRRGTSLASVFFLYEAPAVSTTSTEIVKSVVVMSDCSYQTNEVLADRVEAHCQLPSISLFI